MDAILQDIRTAVRSLRAAPWFTMAVIATLALGLGANTLIFSVVDSVLVNPLAFGTPDRLVAVVSSTSNRNQSVSAPDFVDWRAQAHRLGAVAAYENGTANLTGAAEPVRLKTAGVSANWFALLGVPVTRGRAFTPDEDRVDPPTVVILSDALWRTRFAADPRAIGRTLNIDGAPRTIVGVAPPRFTFPGNPDIWIPETFSISVVAPESRGAHFLHVLGRVAPSATLEGARQEFVTVTERLRKQYMEADADFHYTLEPLQEHVVGEARPALLMLFGAVGCVLLIACANVANLLLVRASGRAGELGVRIALGAGRGRIVRQLLTESLILSLVGAAAGIALAYVGIHLLIAAQPGNLPRLDEVALSAPVLLFTGLVAVCTGLLFGLAPAVQAASPDIVEALKSGMRGASAGRRSSRLRGALVIAETALAVLLLIGAGLLTRSFARMIAVDPGFVPEHVVRFDVNLPDAQYPTWAKLRGFTHGVVANLQALPGTVAAAAAFGVPFGDVGARSSFHVDGRPAEGPGNQPLAWVQIVTPRYFTAMGIPLRAGRVFTGDDRAGGHKAIIVNEALVRQYFPGETALGKSIRVGWSSDSSAHKDTVTMGGEIVGIVGDTKDRDVTIAALPKLYAAFDQSSINYQTFVVRTTADPRAVLGAVQRAVAAVDPTVPIFDARPLAESLRESIVRPRLYAAVVGAFAVVALMLAVIGIYGVLAYAVRERRRELGIRIALGASEPQVIRMVVGQGIRLAGAGLIVGFAIALLGGRLLATLLYGIRPDDPPTFEAVSVALLVVAALASWLPARRAAVIDPIIAMRPE